MGNPLPLLPVMATTPSSFYVQTVDRGQKVRDGMDLLEWDCFHARWEQHLASERYAQPREHANLVVLTMGTSGLATIAAGAAFGLLGSLGVIGAGIVSVFGLTVAESIRAGRRPDPPRVRFTSTGVLVDDGEAWLWRGRDHWLSAAKVVSAFEDDGPCVLELTFQRRWRRPRTLRVPIPPELLTDTREMVAHLRDRIAGRESRPK